VITLHGHEEMEADRLTIFDVEHCILTGEMVGRQRDEHTGDWKYLIEGETLQGARAVTVARIGLTRKLVIITVYLL
jgi:hypothetical protein